MPLTIVVGGQYGGEGKGKIVSHLCRTTKVDCVVRCGGPNSGHTIYYQGKRLGLRLLPAGVVSTKTRLLLAPGALVSPDVLLKEIEYCGIESFRVGIDRNTMIIKDSYADEEKSLRLRQRIGSTSSGTGVGVAKRALRDTDVELAQANDRMRRFVTDVTAEINQTIDEGKTVVIEGTQGFGLSLYHSPFYPYTTSRDTTASGFLSEVGVSPFLVDKVIMAIRTFPIRVEGESGPLKNEISWEKLQSLSGYPYEIKEFTTVTNLTRRVAEFDLDIVKRATQVNRPSEIALHGADYIGYVNKGVTKYEELSRNVIDFIERLEFELDTPVRYIGTGMHDEEIVDRLLNQRAQTAQLTAHWVNKCEIH